MTLLAVFSLYHREFEGFLKDCGGTWGGVLLSIWQGRTQGDIKGFIPPKWNPGYVTTIWL